MRHRRKLFMVCYDICGDGADRRLRRVYKTMRAYGEHIQYSVFRCALYDKQLAELERDLGQAIDVTKDQILLVPLGYADTPEAWKGWTLGLTLASPEQVVRIV